MSDPGYSDKQSISDTTPATDASSSAPEVHIPRYQNILQPCDLCSTDLPRPPALSLECLSCHTRGRFDLTLCQVHLEEGQYFEVINRQSKINCRACSRHLRHHTPEQRLGCWAYFQLTTLRRHPRNYLPGADVYWPAENTHKRNLKDRD